MELWAEFVKWLAKENSWVLLVGIATAFFTGYAVFQRWLHAERPRWRVTFDRNVIPHWGGGQRSQRCVADRECRQRRRARCAHWSAKASKLTGRPDDGALVHLLAYPGPRISEATALQVRDIDFTAEQARVRRTWTVDRDSKRKLGDPKTWEQRAIPLPTFLVAELRELCRGKQPEDFIFTSSRGMPIDGRIGTRESGSSFALIGQPNR